MEISLVDQKIKDEVTHSILDTDDLSHRSAQMVEAQENLCRLAQKLDTPMVVYFFNPKNGNQLHSQHIIVQDMDKKGQPIQVIEEEAKARLNRILQNLDKTVRRLSRGQYGVLPLMSDIKIQ